MDDAWIPVNDLARGLDEQRQQIDAALTQVLDSGWFVLGPQVTGFEGELASYLGVGHALGVASGTDALELAITAGMPGGRSRVLTAANAGGYTSTAARRAGYGLAYADVAEDTHCLTADTVAAAWSDDVGVVVVTHLYGLATDVGPIVDLAHARGAVVVEDCAECIGATVGARRAGSLADLAAFSFYPTKNLGALGDGGAVTTGDAGLADAVRQLRQYGWGGKYRVEANGGVNSRLDEMQAAVLRVRLPQLDAQNARRRALVQRYAAAATERVRVLPAAGPEHVGHLAVAVCEQRDALAAHLGEAFVRIDIHFPVPDHQQTAWRGDHAGVSLPVTERLAGQVITLPVFPQLRDDEVERVCAALARF